MSTFWLMAQKHSAAHHTHLLGATTTATTLGGEYSISHVGVGLLDVLLEPGVLVGFLQVHMCLPSLFML